mmetsp:Transcript_7420/g.7290  ORF Transcript_7420/g.7290 Transcript_7420/m.7290 type:complete len:166 (+) Transcript_7420:470-967(+)
MGIGTTETPAVEGSSTISKVNAGKTINIVLLGVRGDLLLDLAAVSEDFVWNYLLLPEDPSGDVLHWMIDPSTVRPMRRKESQSRCDTERVSSSSSITIPASSIRYSVLTPFAQQYIFESIDRLPFPTLRYFLRMRKREHRVMIWRDEQGQLLRAILYCTLQRQQQ